MFEFINDNLCIKSESLYSPDKLGLISYGNYLKMCDRGKMVRAKLGGNGRDSFVRYDSIPSELKDRIKNLINGNPYELAARERFNDKIESDPQAVTFFNNYIKADGTHLPFEKRREYIANACVLNTVIKMINDRNLRRRSSGGRKAKMWNEILTMLQGLDKDRYPIKLPNTEVTLMRKLRDYQKAIKEGDYSILIHGNEGNSNAEKLCPVAQSWLLARWATQVDKLTLAQLMEEYNRKAPSMNWEPVDDVKSIRNFLYRSDIKEQWFGHRYGELKAKEKYEYQHSTKLPTMRDSLWFSDGTKVNYFYLNEEGKMETISVYEVIDAYSEVFVGYHIAKNEDFEAQFRAFKMAIETSGQKPYEIRYDNQGGHKKLEAGEFLGKLSHLSIRTRPYNGKSKTIENAFARFQQQFLHRDWFFTGQNIQSKRDESKANMEFVLANVKNLPTLDEVMKIYKQRRDEWNNAPHPVTGISRMEMYRTSINPKAVKVETWDMVDLFWITRPEPITLHAYGLTMTEKKVKYTYTAYNGERLPDVEWLRKHVDAKFFVKFDPDDMSLIYIYKKGTTGLEFIRELETKTEVHRGKQEQEAWEAQFFKDVEKANANARIKTRDKTDDELKRWGLHPEQHGLNSPNIKGLETGKRKTKIKAKPVTIGEYEKAVSNAVKTNDDFEDTDLYDLI